MVSEIREKRTHVGQVRGRLCQLITNWVCAFFTAQCVISTSCVT